MLLPSLILIIRNFIKHFSRMGSITQIFAVFISILSLGNCYLEYDGWLNIELHHALDNSQPEKFEYRGNISIPSLNTGLSSTVQEVLSDTQRSSLKMLALGNEFYRLRATVTYPSGVKQLYLTSIKACSLLLSQLNDIFWISIDGSGFVTSITQTTATGGTGDCSDSILSISGLEDFNTDVLIRHMDQAPIPDTASFIQKIERERLAREKGDVQDNRGFLAKYWLYIVPVVLLVVISGATNQDAAK